MVKMEKDVNTRKRKKSADDNIRNSKKSQWTRSGSGSEEDDEELFSWEEYLQKCHARAAPKENFKHVQDTKVQGFVPGMKLECLDRSSLEADTYWVATVVMASGPLLLLRYDGYDDDRSGDFWCDAASEELQPIGWAAKTNNILIPPAAIRHKESNWAKFLMQDLKNAVYAPEHLFHKRSDTEDENQLKPGMKLEVLNKDDQVTYWVASVVDAYGLRLRLRHEGSEDETDDVWLYFLSDDIHQLGWGKKNNFTLKVPSGLKARYPDKDWPQVTDGLLILCQSSTEDILLNESLQKTNSLPKQHGFTSGMKLEAVNPKDPSSICPATVTKVANDAFFQVEIDSLINCGDGSKPSIWCTTNSQNIFPAGWCEKNNIQLTPPPGYLVHPFKWQAYLEWTNSSAAPKTLFTLDVPSHSFEIGMKLEAVDQTNPSTVTVASVTQVVGRTVWVLLDGYKHDSVEHIYDMESYHLFPVGWCSMNGHPLLTPRVQRPPEENRRLSSLRTRTRENKKAAVVSDTTCTAGSANNVSTAIKTTMVNTASKTTAVSTANKTTAVSTANKTTMVNTASKTTAVSTAKRTSPQNTENKSTAGNTGSVTPTVNTTHMASIPSKVANTTNKTGVTNKTITLTTSTTETAFTPSSANITKQTDTVSSSKTGDAAANGQQEGTKEVVVSEVKTEIATPSRGPYSLRASTLVPRDYASQLDASEEETGKEKKNVEAVIDLTGEEEGDEDYVEKDTTKPVTTTASSKSSKKDSGVCIYVRKTCETGPFLKQSKVAIMPPVIGPAGANSVLRQLVEQIVLSAHSSKQVLKLLASETDKMTISSILKTLQTKLSLCENLLSLHKVSLCSQCDAGKHHPVSPTQSAPKNSTPQTLSHPKENIARTTPLRKTGPQEIGTTGVRVNSHPTVSSESVMSPIRRKTLPRFNSEPAAALGSNDEPIAQSPVSAGLPRNESEQRSESADLQVKTPPKGLADDTGLNTEPAVNSPAQTTKHISQWNVDEVSDYIRTTDCHRFAEEFQKQEIDGRALTLLSLDEIHKCLGVTLGPAIKLHFSVQKLRNQMR